MFAEHNGSLLYKREGETLRIDPWGENALRVRATLNPTFTAHDWALPQQPEPRAQVRIHQNDAAGKDAYFDMAAGGDSSFGEITNGKITARVNAGGVLSFYNQHGKLLLKEFWQRLQDDISAPLNLYGRQYRSGEGEQFRAAVRFVANDDEHIFGMGQYQQHQLDMKGCALELAQRNSQVSVPFYISSLGYGFLWNNPAIGQAVFAANKTEWTAQSTKQIDYLVIAGDSPAQIEEAYMGLVGLPPMMPDYGMGFWQCKLRYRTQDELLEVARKHKQLGLPMDVIVADFFHWPKQGDFRFDPKYWPDVKAMCEELESMGIKLMVSVWPTVEFTSENYNEMRDAGHLIRIRRGVPVAMQMGASGATFYDATNPDARRYVWDKCKQNYWDNGAKLFWLDVAEPEYISYDFDHFAYQLGSVLEVGNIYPRLYTQGFYDGITQAGEDKPINLVRSAWAGSAKYGALVWSGDIVSSFECFQRQVRAGLSMAIAGIPWWTTDIGGFHGAATEDPEFHKLFARWFAYGCFCPVFRLHGNRNPYLPFEDGVVGSGSANEVWSYGEDIFALCKKYMTLRERLRPYIAGLMRAAHQKGTPVMRPLFYDFPGDARAWKVDDAYMFGPDLLVAPVLEADSFARDVYLPQGDWVHCFSGMPYTGGQMVRVDAPIDEIPVFARAGSGLEALFR